MDFIWLIPVLPGLGAALNGLVGIRYFSKRTAALVACTTMAGSLALSVTAFAQLLGLEERFHQVTIADWIPAIPLALADGSVGSFEVPWAFTLDPLSAMLILVVTGIGFLIHVYSVAYMDQEPRPAYARYFCYLNLFCFFMLTLVLGSTFLVMFVGWEGVGLSSYLLIGFWYHKQSATDAGKKAFIVNRVGDWGFILGIFLVFFTFGTLDFHAVAVAAAEMPVEAGFGVLSAICLLLFIGAVGKSAQIPLYVWLPDAMEGPTPVSALIHAATMVTAGVYMVGRTAVLFSHAPTVMTIVAVIGGLTALMAATIALVQTDIKRVLAYSTVSQLGYMFLATGGRRLRRRRLPSDDPRVLQSAALPRQRVGHPRDEHGAGHAPDGWLEAIHAGHVRHHVHRGAGHCRHPAAVGLLQQGRDPVSRVLEQQRAVAACGRHGRDDRLLHVPADLHDVLPGVSRARVGARCRCARREQQRTPRMMPADTTITTHTAPGTVRTSRHR